MVVADWVWTNRKAAGAGTDTLAEAKAYYMPMMSADGIKGVMGCYFEDPEHALTQANQVVLDTIARLGALAIEKLVI